MTIDISKIDTHDLFVPNASVFFERQNIEHSSTSVNPLGAVSFIATRTSLSQTLRDLAIACGTEAFAMVNKSDRQDYTGWLFVSDGPWKDATRIVTYQRLWKNHRELTEVDGNGRKSIEVEFNGNNKVRYAGLLEITDVMVGMAIDSARLCSSNAILFSARSDVLEPTSIKKVFHSAFKKENGTEQTSIDWMTLATNLCPLGDLLLRVTGLFDDHEAGVDLIGMPQNLFSLQ